MSRRKAAGYAILGLGCVCAAMLISAMVPGRMAVELRDIARQFSENVSSKIAPASQDSMTVEEAERREEPESKVVTRPVTNPRVVVTKSDRRLYLYSGNEIVQAYRIGLGFSPVGNKVRRGDGRTPEGDFYICVKNPNSRFLLSLQLSYPCAQHAKRGLDEGLISAADCEAIERALRTGAPPPQNTALGGDIFIHGSGSDTDWTLGCVALDDEDIEELYDIVSVGTPVTILP